MNRQIYAPLLLTAVAYALLMTGTIATVALADMIQPNTPQAAQTIGVLRHAARMDALKAQGHTAEDSDVGVYYYQKASEARKLADQLSGGQAVDSADVKHALSTKGVIHLTPSY
jgi:hypothetical protein